MEKIIGVSTLKKVTNGIINKVDERLDGKSFRYLTMAEYEALSDDERNRNDIVYQITDKQLSYNDLEDKPTIPSNVSQLNNDSGFLTEIPEEYITEEEINERLDGKSFVCLTQEEYDNLSDEEKNSDDIIYQIMDAELSYNDLVDTPDLSVFATKEYVTSAINDAKLEGGDTDINLDDYALKSELFSGSYNDLTNKPVIPSVQGLASESYVNQQISRIQHPTYDDTELRNLINSKPGVDDLFSGSYNDLTDKPTIPSISGLATESFVLNKIAEAELNDKEVNLDGLATKDELALKADKTEVPSIQGLASESYVQQELAKLEGDLNNSGVGTGDDNVSDEEKEYVDNMLFSALGGIKFIRITKERYDALTTRDPNTIYIVTEEAVNNTGDDSTDIYNLVWVEGSNLSDTGEVVTNSSQASYRLSNFIRVNPEYDYKVYTSSSSQFQVFYYDKDKNYIGKSEIRNDKTALAIYGYQGFINEPEKVKYMRIRTSDKTSTIEISELRRHDESVSAYQFRNGYSVAADGSMSASASYMSSEDIMIDNYYDYTLTFNGNNTRIVFYNTDGNFISGSCLPSSSGYYNGETTVTSADWPEAARSFRIRFNNTGDININNINEHFTVTKTPAKNNNTVTISSWVQSTNISDTGASVDDVAAMATDYVAIESGYDYLYTLKHGTPFGFKVFYYNSSKTFISSSEVVDEPIGNAKMDIPSGAAYFKLKVSTDNILNIDNINTNVEIKKIPTSEGMLYSFGLISDVHVDAGSDDNFYDHNYATDDYRNALRFLEDEGASFIAYGGDMATGNPGVSEEDYRMVLECLKESHIPSYMISGNHDYGYFFKALIESRKYYIVEKGNDLFIFVNVQDRGTTGGVDREIIDGVRATIEQNANKRIFLFYHYFIRNHGAGDGAPGVSQYTGDTCGDNYTDYPLSKEWADLIIGSPNVIFCHGHSHSRFKAKEVYEYNNYYHADGECHSVHIPSCAVPRNVSTDNKQTNWPEGSEGYMVKVFADRVEFHAIQLSTNRYLTTYNFTVNLPEGI